MKNIIEKCWKGIDGILRWGLSLVFRIVGRELSEGKTEAVIQFVKFGIVGVSNTIVSYMIYAVSLMYFKKIGFMPEIDYLVAQTVGFALSVLWSYYWNSRLVFVKEEGKQRIWWKALIKTYISYSFTGLFLNNLMLFICIKLLNISEFIAPIINIVISVPINFVINKFWAFRSR